MLDFDSIMRNYFLWDNKDENNWFSKQSLLASMSTNVVTALTRVLGERMDSTRWQNEYSAWKPSPSLFMPSHQETEARHTTVYH